MHQTSNVTLGEHGAACWDESFPEARATLPCDAAQCPDVFINVNYVNASTKGQTQRLGYIRLKLQECYGFNHAQQWNTLERDPLYPDVSAVPGFLEYRLDIGRVSELPRSARERITKPPMRRFELRAHIYQARDLPSMDEDGMCNPYVVVTLAGFAGHTRVSEPTCNPQWYQSIKVPLPLPQPIPMSAKIIVQVYDQDGDDQQGGDQLIGSCIIPIMKVDKHMPKLPEWVTLWKQSTSGSAAQGTIAETNVVMGEILCSFQLIPNEEVQKIPLNDITPKMKDCEVEVACVGLREMLSYDNAPVQKPYVEIDCGDRSAEDKYKRTTPSSKPNGANANFLETLTIATRLPCDILFCPSISVRVFDQRASEPGELDPCVGKLTIPLAPYCEWITEAEYVPNNKPRVPPFKISDELSESSSEEEAEVDEVYQHHRTVIPTTLEEANFCPEQEVCFHTPTAQQIKAQRVRGKLGSGRHGGLQTRTVPPTPSVVPFDLVAAGDTALELKNKPLDSELENIIEDPPFDEWHVLRGGSASAAGREVGRFKARIRVLEMELKGQAMPPLDLKDLFEQSVYITRLYVTRGIKLEARDADGLADAFLIVRNGTKKQNVIDDVRNVQENTLNPNFYRCFELPTMVPGNPLLKIEVWDKDRRGAQLIGATEIDLENRIFSQEWVEMEPKPVERRYLWSPASLAPMGKLEMWLEMLTPPDALKSKPKVLNAPLAMDTELRVVVWSVRELILDGKSKEIDVTGSADVLVTIQEDELKAPQESDVHHGATDEAHFNWRYLFDLALPTRKTKLLVQIWDRRSTGPNEALAECTLQLATLYGNVQRLKTMQEVPRQWYTCTHPNHAGPQAKIDLSIWLLPRAQAEQLDMVAGYGRGAPNEHPKLPPPRRGGGALLKGTKGLFGKGKGGDDADVVDPAGEAKTAEALGMKQ